MTPLTDRAKTPPGALITSVAILPFSHVTFLFYQLSSTLKMEVAGNSETLVSTNLHDKLAQVVTLLT
jgi:hypothetical protein